VALVCKAAGKVRIIFFFQILQNKKKINELLVTISNLTNNFQAQVQVVLGWTLPTGCHLGHTAV
jgi:hypothetical protein